MVYSLPIVFISIPVVWWILIKVFPPELESMRGVQKAIKRQLGRERSLSGKGRIALLVLIFTVAMWVTMSDVFGLAVIGLIGAVLLFFTKTLEWEDVEKKVPWGIILLYGGAITLGVNLEKSGAAEWLAMKILENTHSNPIMIVFVLVLVTIIMTNFLSNTVAVAIMLPIGLGLAYSVEGLTSLASCLVIALSGGMAFLFVIATPGNLLSYSSGYFSQRDLLKSGIPATIATIAIIMMITLTYWKALGVW